VRMLLPESPARSPQWAEKGDALAEKRHDTGRSVALVTGHAVVIAGAGPTGLMLAGELALAGADVAIAERRASQDLTGSRAGGLSARSIEVPDQRGIADRFLAQGIRHQATRFSDSPLDISDFPTRHNYMLGLWQVQIEHTLASWVGELGMPIYRGHPVTGFAQDDTGAANPAASTNSPDSTSSSVHLPMNSPIARTSSGVHAGPAAVSLPAIASMSAWEA
jgi:FAD binding domain